MRVRKNAAVDIPKQIKVFFLCWRIRARSRRWFSSDTMNVARRGGGMAWGFMGGGGSALAGGGKRTGATRPGM